MISILSMAVDQGYMICQIGSGAIAFFPESLSYELPS